MRYGGEEEAFRINNLHNGMSIFGNHGRAESSKSQHQPLQTLSFNQTAQRLVYIPLVEGNSSFKREATEKTLIYEVKKNTKAI